MKNRLLIVSFNSLSRTHVLLREESGSLEEGEIPVEALQSKSAVNTAASKKPFAFIERTWEVKNPTEEEVGGRV